jgi:hypothetical protein
MIGTKTGSTILPVSVLASYDKLPFTSDTMIDEDGKSGFVCHSLFAKVSLNS